MDNVTNKTKIFRLVIPDAANSFVVSDGVVWVIMANVGANDLKFNFDEDGATNYYTLKAGKETQPFRVKSGRTMNTDGVGGATTIELITWG